MDDDTEGKNQLGVFLDVKKTADGYVERDRKGVEKNYVRSGVRELTIENIKTHRGIHLETGVESPLFRGITREKIRALGVTGDYPIFDVSIGVGPNPGTAKITNVYTCGGHSLRASMTVEVSSAAAAAIAIAFREARSTRVIALRVKEGSFWGTSKDAWGDVLLLPWITDQRVQKHDEVIVECDLSVTDLTVMPEFSGALSSVFEEPQSVNANVGGSVGIHYSSSDHPLHAAIQQLSSELILVRASLQRFVWIIVIMLAALIWRVW